VIQWGKGSRANDCILVKKTATAYSTNNQWDTYTVTSLVPPPPPPPGPTKWLFTGSTAAERDASVAAAGFTKSYQSYFDYASHPSACVTANLALGSNARGNPKFDEGISYFSGSQAVGKIWKTMSGSGALEIQYGGTCTTFGPTYIMLGSSGGSGGTIQAQTTAWKTIWKGTYTNGQELKIQEGNPAGSANLFYIRECPGLSECPPPPPPPGPAPLGPQDSGLFVTCPTAGAIARFNQDNGTYVEHFQDRDLKEPMGMVYHKSLLYVLDRNTIRTYDAETGEFMEVFASHDGLDATYLVFHDM